jgi:hypothetical protein
MVRTAHCFLFGFVFSSVLSCVAPQIARGDDATGPVLLPAAKRILAWLPDDTETITAARSFQIEDYAAPGDQKPRGDIDRGIRLFTLEGLWDLNDWKFLKPLTGTKVVVALCGARNFEVVSSFGSLRYEGCGVIVFENKLEDLAKGWLQAVRAGAKKIRRIENREVFVYPSTTVMESTYEQMPWQGTFIVVVQPNTLLCATSDRYLTDVLKRLDAKSPGRAPLLDLPEWKHIDPKSSSWLLRHIPGQGGRRKISGLTLSENHTGTGNNAGFRVVYLPVAGSAERVSSSARGIWRPAGFDAHSDLRLQKDGAVVVSSTVIDPPLIWAIYHLPGEDGSLNTD